MKRLMTVLAAFAICACAHAGNCILNAEIVFKDGGATTVLQNEQNEMKSKRDCSQEAFDTSSEIRKVYSHQSNEIEKIVVLHDFYANGKLLASDAVVKRN